MLNMSYWKHLKVIYIYIYM
uniref:Uncharacterized protein n=1 Tax=Heterorhabditis bacteriophora TaxID=37862 RepID=A0A1I7WBA6_HETBA